MKEILAELYTKVMSFFQSEKGENTKDIASNRLKLVLMHDRTKLDPLTLEKMRFELIDVISKYIVIDKDLLELNLAGEGDSIALMLNIPVLRAKSEQELQEEAEQRKLQEAAENEDDDNDEDDEDENVDESEDIEEETSEETIDIENESEFEEESSQDEVDEEQTVEASEEEVELQEPDNDDVFEDEGMLEESEVNQDNKKNYNKSKN